MITKKKVYFKIKTLWKKVQNYGKVQDIDTNNFIRGKI